MSASRLSSGRRFRLNSCDRLGAEDLHAVQRAAAQHHAAEAHVVVRGRDQSAAAGFQLRRLGIGADLPASSCSCSPPPLLRHVAGGETLDLLRRAPERGVVHAQRLEQPRAQEFAEGHAATVSATR